MAAINPQFSSLNIIKPAAAYIEQQNGLDIPKEEAEFNYSQRSQWLRAAVLGANDGLVSTASLIMGVGGFQGDAKTMILTGFAGLVAGASSMAIGEFVSVYSQLDIELAQMKRKKTETDHDHDADEDGDVEHLPNTLQAALESALSFLVGAMVPLLSAAFIKNRKVRLGVVAGVASLALLVFGGVGAVLGKAPVMRSSLRVLIGGWLAMAVTYGLTRLLGSSAGGIMHQVKNLYVLHVKPS